MPSTRQPRLDVVADRRGDALLVLRLGGELDLESVGDLHAAVAAGPAEAALVLDLRELMFIDTSGLRAILDLETRCSRSPRRPFALVPGRPALHRVFEVSGLVNLLRFVQDPDDVR